MKIDKAYKPELVVSQDKTRLHLTQVHLDVAGARVIATDGIALVVCPVEPSDSDVSGSVPVAAIKRARKLCKQVRSRSADGKRWEHTTQPCTLDLSDTAKVTLSDTRTLPRPVLDKFPKTDHVIPDYGQYDTSLVRVKLNAYKLWQLAAAMGVDGGVMLTFPAPTKNAVLASIKVTPVDDDNRAHGVLMPIR